MTHHFEVQRADLRQCRLATTPSPSREDLADGQIVVAVDVFALTANNVTYGAAGDMIGYWNFFPAQGEGWGRIPVWGFADVVESKHADVAVGERLYGFFPMSTHLVMTPGAITADRMIDTAEHRAQLPLVYNVYNRVAADPMYTQQTEALQALFRPLFLTAFLLDDFLSGDDLAGVETILLTSASSKTAMALASLLTRNQRVPGGVVGLTSAKNVGFVEGLGCYDQVVTYDNIPSLDATRGAAVVDMAGNGAVLSAVHHHFGDQLRVSCQVGMADWEHTTRTGELPGATPAFFFAPDQAVRLAERLGPEGMSQAMAAGWGAFLEASAGWLDVVEGRGGADVERVYRSILEGEASPRSGFILKLE